jgi:hypothetical protein
VRLDETQSHQLELPLHVCVAMWQYVAYSLPQPGLLIIIIIIIIIIMDM